ncbi:TIGR03086 family metal-binding protein [Dermatobacter hominis]|uniref:TIGR03086 family metal-binding protein n=1 Tax=Dermatobacter hominis TaxID=2884263 RepID=UPI001D12513D|nr:TIGR03086 family metal-binding protein [Dermatobacter hominis]UDY34434.1 TIGR03086 family protein [Dermatobacter hominis]
MIDLRPAASRMVAVIDALDDRQLCDPTPCAATSVGDLVVHVDQVAQGAVALAARDEDGMRAAGAIVADGSRLGPRWRAEVRDDLDAAAEAWTRPAAWAPGAAVPGSDLDAATWGRITLTELVVHGWDLAVATGQPFDVPEPTLQACWDHVRVFVPDAPFPGLWGPPVEVPAGAPLLDRLLATTGRDPARW